MGILVSKELNNLETPIGRRQSSFRILSDYLSTGSFIAVTSYEVHYIGLDGYHCPVLRQFSPI